MVRFLSRIAAPITVCLAAALVLFAMPIRAQQPAFPWLDQRLSPDARAALVLKAMTLDEKIQLVHSRVTSRDPQHPPPAGPEDEQGYVPGIPRLGLPPLHMVDGNLGVANPWNARGNDEATALPSGLALAATWNPTVAFADGAVAGAEARSRGFNVLLAGSVNLVRDPHGGRTFEYAGEDPLLAGTMVGEAIRGIQSQHVISTVKHFAVNDRESGRFEISAEMNEKALRESDLLAFQIAIERGDPGSVMCAYNKVNGVYACENSFLLQTVLRSDWNYHGWVMSDWGAVHSTVASAEAGLDQESGADKFDKQVYFGDPLKEAIEEDEVPMARLDAMVAHILRTMFAKGIIDDPPARHPADGAAHFATAERIAEQGIVLLRNEKRLLPLRRDRGDIAVIGAHADRGVLSGGGSSQVRPIGGPALILPPSGDAPRGSPNTVWDPSSPLTAIAAEAPKVRIRYADGTDIAAATALAKEARVAIVFAQQWMTEGWDRPDLSLPNNQDRLIEAVAAANPRTIVVLETGGPVLMPWLARVGAVLEAWYPGQGGGKAIARILFGKAAPSGRLPVTFPARETQLPAEDRVPSTTQAALEVRYGEGTAVGYRWFETTRETPLFPFGYGLTYTRFNYADLHVARPPVAGSGIRVSFILRNTGRRMAAETAQIYISRATSEGALPRRLAAWQRMTLRPGEARRVTLDLDPHALQSWSRTRHQWERPPGEYRIHVGASATDDRLAADLSLR